MKQELLSYVAISIVLLFGVALVVKNFFMSKRIGVNVAKRGEIGHECFNAVGLKISVKSYMMYRRIALILATFIIFVSALRNQDMMQGLKTLIPVIIIYLFTFPAENICGRDTPFGRAIYKLKIRDLAAKDEELAAVIMQLKNLAITQRENPWGSDYIIQMLMKFTNRMRPIFSETLALMRRGKRDEAYDLFKKSVGTKLGSDFATVLFRLDDLNPIEFQELIEVFQTDLKEQKKTKRLKSQIRYTNLIYAGASIEAMLIIMNFIIMVMYITMNEM